MLQHLDSERKFGYEDTAISSVVIDSDEYGAFGLVPSGSSDGQYKVTIDESTDIPQATSCECDGNAKYHRTCHHMNTINQYYLRIASIFAKEEVTEPEETVSLVSVMQEAQDAVSQMIEEATVQGDKSYAEMVTNIYEVLAPTKKVTHAYGCCGHIVKLEDAGELCGPCRCK